MVHALLLLMPEEAMVAAFVIASLLYMIGMRKIASTIIGFVLIIALAGPVINALLAALPDWAFWTLLVVGSLSLIGSLMGKGVRDHVVAGLLIIVITYPFKFVGWMLRGLKQHP